MMINNSAGEIVLRRVRLDVTPHPYLSVCPHIFCSFQRRWDTSTVHQVQRLVPAVSAQPIVYALSPLLGSIWACLVLHESISSSEVYTVDSASRPRARHPWQRRPRMVKRVRSRGVHHLLMHR